MDSLPLPTLLSQPWVALTIEADNEFEHRMEHRTSLRRERQGPWLTSMVMWWTCLRVLEPAGMTIRDMELRARARTNLDGMRRWGYITIESTSRSRRPRPSDILRPTRAGQMAARIWEELVPEIEGRWRDRLGGEYLDDLRTALSTVVRHLDPALPDFLPILHYGLSADLPGGLSPPIEAPDVSTLPLFTLLARPLLAFTLEFETRSRVSLAICANVLRLVGDEG